MGYALAEAAKERGGAVTLISGPVNLTASNQITVININSTAELARAVTKQFPSHDALIMAAAPSDFTPSSPANQKMKKDKTAKSVELSPTVDILKAVSSLKKKHQKLVGFALETENGIANAKKKLTDKKLDMIVLNMPGDGTAFDSDTNQVTIIRPRGKPVELKLADKSIIAHQILDYIIAIL